MLGFMKPRGRKLLRHWPTHCRPPFASKTHEQISALFRFKGMHPSNNMANRLEGEGEKRRDNCQTAAGCQAQNLLKLTGVSVLSTPGQGNGCGVFKAKSKCRNPKSLSRPTVLEMEPSLADIPEAPSLLPHRWPCSYSVQAGKDSEDSWET